MNELYGSLQVVMQLTPNPVLHVYKMQPDKIIRFYTQY